MAADTDDTRPYVLTVTLKVLINGSTKELAADHLAKVIGDFGLEGIELAALADITVKVADNTFTVPDKTFTNRAAR